MWAHPAAAMANELWDNASPSVKAIPMTNDLQQRILTTGLWLYQLIADETPSVFRKGYWMGRVMDWSMENEAFKVEMFRFVDVFPCLTRPESVAKHLKEYFCRSDQDSPLALQWGIKSLSHTSIAAKMVAKTIGNNITTMATQFIAGRDAHEALPILTGLRSQGLAFTADLLGEAVVSEAEADDYCRRYLDLLQILDTAQHQWPALGDSSTQLDWDHAPKINVSIKPSAMYSQMSARSFAHSLDMAQDRLRPLFRQGMRAGALMMLDMESTAFKNLTLSLYRSLLEEPEFRDYPHTGVVIQAYLRDSERDLVELIRWGKKRKQRFTIRLAKGAYWDAEVIQARQNNWPVPVFTDKAETDANFEKLARILLENHQTVTFACASHSIRSIAAVMEMAKDLKVPEERLEYQILFGMAEPVRTALCKAGLPLRLYVPMGEMIPGMAYLVRRLLENTANESFLRQSFAKAVSRDELLRDPLEILRQTQALSRPPNSARQHQAIELPPFRQRTALGLDHRRSAGSSLQAPLQKVGKEFPYQSTPGDRRRESEHRSTDSVHRSQSPGAYGGTGGIGRSRTGSGCH